MKAKALFVAVVLLALIWPTPGAAQKPAAEDAVTPDEYAVYNAYLRTVLRSKHFAEDELPSKQLKTLVIVDHTGGPYKEKDEPNWSKYVKGGLQGMDPGLVDVFLTRNKAAAPVENHFETSLNVTFVSQEEIDGIFKQGAKNPDFGWDGFYRKFPDSQGFTRLSRVAFSSDGKQALLRVDTSCDWLCGAGYMVLLEKKEDVWIVKKGLMLWVS
ncbi:MAG TPA: hypothetical protein VEG08_01495 [Terriglobales bacterium]|nr:hypothetical protein [Terriglobales bacterium]